MRTTLAILAIPTLWGWPKFPRIAFDRTSFCNGLTTNRRKANGIYFGTGIIQTTFSITLNVAALRAELHGRCRPVDEPVRGSIRLCRVTGSIRLASVLGRSSFRSVQARAIRKEATREKLAEREHGRQRNGCYHLVNRRSCSIRGLGGMAERGSGGMDCFIAVVAWLYRNVCNNRPHFCRRTCHSVGCAWALVDVSFAATIGRELSRRLA